MTAEQHPSTPYHRNSVPRIKGEDYSLEELGHKIANTKKGAGRPDKIQRAALRLLILKRWSSGRTEEQIAIELGMPEESIKQHLIHAQQSAVRYYQKPAAQEHFIRYASFQFQQIDRLQQIIDALMAPVPDPAHKQPRTRKKTKTPPAPQSAPLVPGVATGRTATAAVQAIRAQSDIYDKILDRGISMGVIQEKPHSDLTGKLNQNPNDLRVYLKGEVETLLLILDKVDDQQALRFKQRKQRNTTPHPYHGRKIRKGLKDDMGSIFAVRDWKFKGTQWTTQGKYIPKEKQETPQHLKRKEKALEQIQQTQQEE